MEKKEEVVRFQHVWVGCEEQMEGFFGEQPKWFKDKSQREFLRAQVDRALEFSEH